MLPPYFVSLFINLNYCVIASCFITFEFCSHIAKKVVRLYCYIVDFFFQIELNLCNLCDWVFLLTI